ncbi:potassium channel subfamily K member 2-like [Amphiura filiformis]|uniref:potassium channel subfamily K member 2-like n=1 Tax=Amphiura filiformis TaxID=82378 RepID=UPI003B21397F
MISWKSISLLFVVLQIYLIIGMIAFHFLESDNETVVRVDTRQYKERILANFTCLTEENLEALISVISTAISNGIDPSNNASSPSNWEYHQAYFFSGTVITTIGYGHISPSTRSGQSFVVLYALIGIPICGILLSAIGDRFNKFKDKLLMDVVYQKLEMKWQRKTFSLLLMCGVGMTFFILIPSAIFTAIEGWSYHVAVYYCFISLTTVGFGDYVAGQNPDIRYPAVYKIMVFYWILFGLVYLAIIIQDISDAFSSSVENFEKRQSKKLAGMNGAEKGLAEKKSDLSDESDDKENDKSTERNNKVIINGDNGEVGSDTYM